MNAAESMLHRWREDRWLRIAVAVLAFAAVTAVTYLIAHPRMYTGFASYDDEGYMLTALKGFVNHGHLYDDVFTQYGPFYYEFFGGIFSGLGIPVTHDGGRAVTMTIWIVSSLAIGLATMRFTASLLLGLATQVLVFNAIGVLTNEPMHPGGIICLLLATIVVIASLVRDRPAPYALAALGATVAALFLVKINLGLFAIASVTLACVVSYPLLGRLRLLRPLVELGFVVLPFALVLSKFGEDWARHYAFHVSLAALAVVIVLRARKPQQRSLEELPWLLGGFLVLAAVSCLAIVAAGTSLSGLYDGIIGQPLRQADAFTIPAQFSRRGDAIDLIGLGAACAYWYSRRRRGGGKEAGGGWLALISMFSIGVGLQMVLSVGGKALPWDVANLPFYQLSMLCFVWVALIAPAPGSSPTTAFARLLVPLLAVLQALHAFPVAGSQTMWSAFLLIPVGAICVANGVRGLDAAIADRVDRRALAGAGAVAAVVLLWFIGNGALREPLESARANYDGAVPLGLPGSADVRLSPEEDETYRSVTQAMRENCASTVMLPGMGSFYIWAEQEPPSYLATGWETLFDEHDQRQVIDDTRGIRGLCLLRNRAVALGWGEAPGPLVSYLEQPDFKLIYQYGAYELLQRRGTAGAGA